MAASRKLYVEVAKALNAQLIIAKLFGPVSYAAVADTVSVIAEEFKKDNPAFDIKRFNAACGYGE